MRVLAIETVEFTGSVAALEGEQLLLQLPLSAERRSAQTLVPGVQALLADVGWLPGQIELVAVATGPGSFTGLRIGVTTAKTLAYAVSCEVMGVNTLEAIAQAVPLEVPSFSVVVDAQRGELFVADFQRSASGAVTGAESTRVETREAFLASLRSGNVVTGSALRTLRAALPSGVNTLAETLWAPSSVEIGRLAWRQFNAGQRTTAIELMPVYYRRTAAEEQWERRQARSSC
jgi:tRNA threonylcarbamoyladenosine biosynthesis protein TsaB